MRTKKLQFIDRIDGMWTKELPVMHNFMLDYELLPTYCEIFLYYDIFLSSSMLNYELFPTHDELFFFNYDFILNYEIIFIS
jgi:hypothetical protein